MDALASVNEGEKLKELELENPWARAPAVVTLIGLLRAPTTDLQLDVDLKILSALATI